MARRGKGDAPAKEPKAEGGKGRSNLVPALVVAAGLVVGGFLMKGGGGGSAAAAAHETPTSTTAPKGDVVKLDPVTMNLADGRYLKVTLALQLAKATKADEFTKSGRSAEVLDLAVTKFSHHTMAELQPPDARDQVKDELSTAVATTFKDEVLQVYVTEFVMQ